MVSVATFSVMQESVLRTYSSPNQTQDPKPVNLVIADGNFVWAHIRHYVLLACIQGLDSASGCWFIV